MALKLDANGYNANFNAFIEFASSRIATDNKAIARFEIGAAQHNGDRNIVAANPEDDKVGKFRRHGDQRDLNNAVRASFREAIIDMFGGEAKIPASVRKAMLLADFGKGKPLTARRIMAVKAAIDADGTAKARAAREAVIENHKNAQPLSNEAQLAKFTGRFTSSEAEFAKGLALFGQMKSKVEELTPAQRRLVASNLSKAGAGGISMFETMYRLILEEVESDPDANLDMGGELFTPANNGTLRLALLEYTGNGFKAAMSLQPGMRKALARILDRFMDAGKGAIRQGERPVVQDDFVRRLAANINELDRLDRAGKLTARALVKICYPEVRRPGNFNLGNAVYANVENLNAVRNFMGLVRTGSYYSFDDEDYTNAINDLAEELRGRLGEDFVPTGINFNKLVRGSQLATEIEALAEEAIAKNRQVDVNAFADVVARLMVKTVAERRMDMAMHEIAKAKGANNLADITMSVQLLARRPELYDVFRAARTPEAAAAALESVRGAMEEAVEREIALRNLIAPTIDNAAVIIAGKLGISPDEAKAQVKFGVRVKEKLNDLINEIQKGKHPGSLSPDFNPALAFEDVARKVVGEYTAKFDEIDALEGLDAEVKAVLKQDISKERKPTDYDMAKIARFAGRLDVAEMTGKLADPQATDNDKIAAIKRFCDNFNIAGIETFAAWTNFGPEEKSSIALMAMRVVIARAPAFKDAIVEALATEDNILVRATPEVGERQYVLALLRNMFSEE